MTISDLFFGTSGRVFSHAGTVLILLMLIILTANLLGHRRKKAYLSLTVSLFLIIIRYGLLIGHELGAGVAAAGDPIRLLHIASFLLIHMGIFQLYNYTGWREGLLMAALFSVAAGLAGLGFYVESGRVEVPLSFLSRHELWLDVYLVFLTVLAMFLVAPFIGQRGKYRFSLLLYAGMVIAGLLNREVLERPSRVLELMENGLPVVFYMILFFIVFNRVVELFRVIYETSIKDPLTGLYNRSYFVNRIADSLDRGEPVSVIFCDIDNFKRLNDTKGHRAGDRALMKVAGIIRRETRRVGIAGRYGGEELVALVNDASLRVEQIAEQIRKCVEKETGVTVSIGFSKYRKGATAAQLIEEADQAMYRSKQTGKNRVTGYAP